MAELKGLIARWQCSKIPARFLNQVRLHFIDSGKSPVLGPTPTTSAVSLLETLNSGESGNAARSFVNANSLTKKG